MRHGRNRGKRDGEKTEKKEEKKKMRKKPKSANEPNGSDTVRGEVARFYMDSVGGWV